MTDEERQRFARRLRERDTEIERSRADELRTLTALAQAATEVERLKVERDDWYMRALKAEHEIERLRAALRGALSMVNSFASGPGFSTAGRAEYENFRRALEPKP